MEAALNITVITLEAIGIEMPSMRAAVLQNRSASDITITAQGGVCAMLHQECCAYIPEVQSFVNHSVLIYSDCQKIII